MQSVVLVCCSLHCNVHISRLQSKWRPQPAAGSRSLGWCGSRRSARLWGRMAGLMTCPSWSGSPLAGRLGTTSQSKLAFAMMRRCMAPSGQTTHFMEPVWISEIKTLTDLDSGIIDVNFIISRYNVIALYIILKIILRIDTSYNKRYYTWTTSTGMNDYYSKVGGCNIDITLH